MKKRIFKIKRVSIAKTNHPKQTFGNDGKVIDLVADQSVEALTRMIVVEGKGEGP